MKSHRVLSDCSHNVLQKPNNICIFVVLTCLESEDFADDETCDANYIEQTDKGYRCAVDVPSVLYK